MTASRITLYFKIFIGKLHLLTNLCFHNICTKGVGTASLLAGRRCGTASLTTRLRHIPLPYSGGRLMKIWPGFFQQSPENSKLITLPFISQLIGDINSALLVFSIDTTIRVYARAINPIHRCNLNVFKAGHEYGYWNLRVAGIWNDMPSDIREISSAK